jgi:hypothetical protein
MQHYTATKVQQVVHSTPLACVAPLVTPWVMFMNIARYHESALHMRTYGFYGKGAAFRELLHAQ